MSSTAIGILLTCVTSLMYGVFAPAARGAYIEGANIVFVMLVNNFTRSSFLFAWCLYKKIPIFINKFETIVALKCGFIHALSAIGNMAALLYLPAPVACIISLTSTFMLLFFMIWSGEMESNKYLFFTTFISLIGLTLVIDLWNVQGQGHLLGYGFALLGAVATATRLYAFGKLTQSKPAIGVGAETFMSAFIFLGLLLFYQSPIAPQTLKGNGYTLLAVVTTFIGSFTMFWGIARIGAFHFSLYSKIEPIWGAVFSVILLHEVLKPGQYMGMVIVIVSLVSYQIWDHRRKSVSKV